MTRRAGEAPHHRNLTCYVNYECRRPDCVDRYNAHERDRRRQKRQGTYARYTDAAPIRAHVHQLLAAGASARNIADRADVADKTVRDLLPTRADGTRTPLKHRMLTTNAHKILAIRPEDVIPRYVSAVGTLRRAQAAITDGWPMTHLAEQAGMHPSYISNLLLRADTIDDLKVYGTAAHAIARVYDDLRGKKPERHGISRKGAAAARRYGKTRNWPPTSYWDQFPGAIDDPHFIPEYGKLRAQIIAEEAAWLMTIGRLNRDQAAARLGIARFTIDRALREHPQDGLEVAA